MPSWAACSNLLITSLFTLIIWKKRKDFDSLSSSIFLSILPPAGKGCSVYDVVVSPSFMEKMKTSELFKTFFLTVMMEGLEQKYDTELSRGNIYHIFFY